jgi:hypothetical protein
MQNLVNLKCMVVKIRDVMYWGAVKRLRPNSLLFMVGQVLWALDVWLLAISLS